MQRKARSRGGVRGLVSGRSAGLPPLLADRDALAGRDASIAPHGDRGRDGPGRVRHPRRDPARPGPVARHRVIPDNLSTREGPKAAGIRNGQGCRMSVRPACARPEPDRNGLLRTEGSSPAHRRPRLRSPVSKPSATSGACSIPGRARPSSAPRDTRPIEKNRFGPDVRPSCGSGFRLPRQFWNDPLPKATSTRCRWPRAWVGTQRGSMRARLSTVTARASPVRLRRTASPMRKTFARCRTCHAPGRIRMLPSARRPRIRTAPAAAGPAGRMDTDFVRAVSGPLGRADKGKQGKNGRGEEETKKPPANTSRTL